MTESPDVSAEPESYLEFHENEHGEWFWRHLARNHEQLSRSSETYVEERGAADGARLSVGEERIAKMQVKRFPFEGERA